MDDDMFLLLSILAAVLVPGGMFLTLGWDFQEGDWIVQG